MLEAQGCLNFFRKILTLIPSYTICPFSVQLGRFTAVAQTAAAVVKIVNVLRCLAQRTCQDYRTLTLRDSPGFLPILIG